MKLKRLANLFFADPLYFYCPLAKLANYRLFVIYHLPELLYLDGYVIEEDERINAKVYTRFIFTLFNYLWNIGYLNLLMPNLFSFSCLHVHENFYKYINFIAIAIFKRKIIRKMYA